MTQEATPVGGDGNPADANPADAFNAIADEMLGAEPEEDNQAPDGDDTDKGDDAQGDDTQGKDDGDDLSDEDLDGDDGDKADNLPPIDPPNSLTAEEKEAFKDWPRGAQEAMVRRVGELEKGFQSKAQEAAQIKQAAQLEALKAVEQIKAESAERLQAYAQQFEMKPPSAALLRSDPDGYAQQLEAYQYYTAQRESAQRDADKAKAEQAQIQQARAEHEAVAFRQQLEAELPEIFDPVNGQQLAQELNATAELLGFDPNEISDVTAIKALKLTSDWKSKADKYDALMKRKMERVRSGKNPPPISTPGTARLPEQNRKARADQAWQTAKTAKSRPQRDDALATWAENSGWL
jgi:hypothetical protein